MKIIVNKNKQETSIRQEVNKCLDVIRRNANEGIATSEFYVDKHIYFKVKRELLTTLKELGNDARQLDMGGVLSKLVGSNRYFKIRICD